MPAPVYVRQQTLAEVAAILRCSPSTAQRWLRAGAPHDKHGPNCVRLSAEEIQAWIVEREAARAVLVSAATHDTYGDGDWPCTIYTVTIGSIVAQVWLDDEDGSGRCDNPDWLGTFGDYLAQDEDFDFAVVRVPGQVDVSPQQIVQACQRWRDERTAKGDAQ